MTKPTPHELAEKIAWYARFLAKMLADPELPARWRKREESRLSRALKAIETPKWKLSTLQLAIVQVIDSPAGHLAAGRVTEDVAVKRATEGIKGVLADRDVSEAFRAAVVPRALVLACLRSWPRKGGRGRVAAGITKHCALHMLFVKLGIARGGPTAIKQLLQRKARARPKSNR